MSNRRRRTEEDVILERQVKEETSVNFASLAHSLKTGQPIEAKSTSSYGTDFEPEGLHMDMNNFLHTAASVLGNDGINTALQDVHSAREGQPSTFGTTNPNMPRYAAQQPQQPQENLPQVSRNQWRAVLKYPALVEFLGRDDGEVIASKILAEVNVILAQKIGERTAALDDNAKLCMAEKKNIKQYFQGDGWVCKITASGPFRGDEVFYYKKESDQAYILRQSGAENEFEDVTPDFNLIHDYADVVPEIKEEEPNEAS